MIQSSLWQEPALPTYHFPALASTNQTAWQLFQAGKVPPFIVTADEQSAGKGQWGRQWISAPGGLYLSLLLTPEISIEQPSHLTIASVFGVTELLACYQIPVQIKWLNDIFLNGKKLAGVLTETRVQDRALKAVVIGIGVNWENTVPAVATALKSYLDEIKQPATCQLSSQLQLELNQAYLPQSLVSLADLKKVVTIGLLWGYQRYSQEGITRILPRYEARLLS